MTMLEEYLAGLNGRQMWAATLKFWAEAGGKETGVQTLERWRAGQLRIRFEEHGQPAPTTPTLLVGKLVKTLRLAPYEAASVADAIALGRYDGVTDDIVRLFADDEVGLSAETGVDLFQFDRDPSDDELSAWAKANGRQPIMPKHAYAIGEQFPDDQRNAPIVARGSVRDGFVLYLRGGSDWRDLRRHSVRDGWGRHCLFGFLSE